MPEVRHLLFDAELTGGQVFARTLALALRELGWASSFVVPADGPLVGLLEADGFRVTEVPAGGPTRVTRRLRRDLVDRRPDVLHSHVVLPGQLAARLAGRAARVPVVTHYHLVPPTPHGRRGTVFRWVDGWGSRHLSAANLAVSAHVADAVRAWGVRPVEVLRNGVPIPADAPAGGDDRTLLVVGRLTAAKGQEVAVRALAELDARYQLRLLGKAIGAEGEAGARRIREVAQEVGVTDRVHVVPTSPSAPDDEMRRAHALLVPSLAGEGLPLVVLEAMARRLPVIATGVAGIPEVVVPGRTGFLVPPGDPGALAAAVRSLASDPDQARSVADAARLAAEVEHDIETVARRCAAVYQAVRH